MPGRAAALALTADDVRQLTTCACWHHATTSGTPGACDSGQCLPQTSAAFARLIVATREQHAVCEGKALLGAT